MNREAAAVRSIADEILNEAAAVKRGTLSLMIVAWRRVLACSPLEVLPPLLLLLPLPLPVGVPVERREVEVEVRDKETVDGVP